MINPKKPSAVIIDIDGTLSNNIHRIPYLLIGNFQKYMELSSRDIPYQWVVELIGNLNDKGILVILLTGRPENYREITEHWLRTYNINYHKLIMKPVTSPDKRPKGAQFKMRTYLEEIEPNYRVLFALEDEEEIVKMYRTLGVGCLDTLDRR